VARTPLLRAFQRLAEEHRSAARLGIQPAELRGRRQESAVTRREFLKRAGATGAAAATVGPLAFAQRASASSTPSAPPRIAIVGGGIAGLCAALKLSDKGIASTIYEASPDRIGGRMHSDNSGYWANNQVSEFCGELIDSGHTTIRGLAKRFGLRVDNLLAAQPRGSDDTYYFLGSYYPVDQADTDFAAFSQTLFDQADAAGYPTTWDSSTPTGQMLDHTSVYDWIEAYVPGGHHSPMGRLLDSAYGEEYGADTNGQASLNLVYLLAFQPSDTGFEIFGVSDEKFHIAGGNQQLPEAIAGQLDNVQLGWSLQSVATRRDGTVALTFGTGGRARTVIADHAILALPFAVLRNLDFSGAGFDARKTMAITQLGAGRNAKLQLQFASRYWNTKGPWGKSTGSTYTDIGIQNTWDVTRAQDGATGIIVDYSGGSIAAGYTPSTPYSNAATNPQVTPYAKAFLRQLEHVFPGITPQWTGKATLSTPFRDPLLNLSYSYWKVGQYTLFSGYEGVPQGNIHFAGEHCSQDFQGYMEGGASEGIRAAKEVIAAL
jgi:monoamine oxidase